ncbi:MAG: hypothetical protein IT168_25780 [Bryobacterales bacterium]|nr:hypothetical protein [Bryobacterales bacterium]
MTIIELPDDQASALKSKAAAQGLSLQAWLTQLAGEEKAKPKRAKKSGFGLLAKYGPGPSAEDIDENRRDMFQGFGDRF